MRDIFKRDLEEAKRGDIRSKFDSTYIPHAHTPPEDLIPGVHGWIDADGVLHPFDPNTDEITPRSLDAWQEKRLESLEAENA